MERRWGVGALTLNLFKGFGGRGGFGVRWGLGRERVRERLLS
jgi:hypothetical protein